MPNHAEPNDTATWRTRATRHLWILLAFLPALAACQTPGPLDPESYVDDWQDWLTFSAPISARGQALGWSPEDLADLRWCESRDDYWIDTGNSYYGAYQFNQTAWDEAMRHAGLDAWVGVRPNQAWTWVQDVAVWSLADLVHTRYGQAPWKPWPTCGPGAIR